MCQIYATSDFEVPGVRAIVAVAGQEVEGHLTARGRVEERGSCSESSTGAAREQSPDVVTAINGLFGTDSHVDLGRAGDSCSLRFSLHGRILSVPISAQRSGMTGIWLITAADDSTSNDRVEPPACKGNAIGADRVRDSPQPAGGSG